jgi:predicted acyl esterase
VESVRQGPGHLDATLTTDDVPAYSFDRVAKLAPGEIVDIEIDLLPIGLVFHPGEQLRFVISSRNLLGILMPGIGEYVGANTGTHVIHTGGRHASYLQLPLQNTTSKTEPRVRLAGDDTDRLELFSAHPRSS